jgi:CBS domain-containing protein
MRVQDVVRRKASPLVTIEPNATVGMAVRLLMEQRVGGLPVMQGRRLVGFVSERDIVELLPAYPDDVRDQPVSRAMQKPPVCRPDEPLRDVMGRMTRDRLRHLVACDGDEVVGIISVGDIVKHRLDELELETGVLRDYVAARRAAT